MKSTTTNSTNDGTPAIRRFLSLLRRRAAWALLSGVVAVAAITAVVSSVEPTHRATMTLRLEDRTLPLGFDPTELQAYADEDVRARSERVLAPEALGQPVEAVLDDPNTDLAPLTQPSLERIDRIRIDGIDADILPPVTGDLSKVAISFTATLDDPDPDAAERVMRAVQARFLADDRNSGLSPATPVTGLAASRVEVNRMAQTIAELETEIETFERQNAAGIPELYELNAQAMERVDRERAQLDVQIQTLEERRMDLDQALRDIERDGAEGRAGEEIDPLTSRRLVALQSERAMLIGLYAADHPEAQRLGAEIDELQSSARERLDLASAELREANEELARLERVYAIDHPDVVRLAHQVSALESRIEAVTLTGLTVGERRYIEGLAGERRDIDGRLDQLRAREETLREDLATYESRALEGPILEQQYAALKERLARVKADHEAAQARADELQFQQRIAEQTAPGHLSVVEPVRLFGPLPMTRPAIIAALGAMLAVIGVLAVVMTVERLDRRILGARRIEELQGAPPLAEIPFIHAAGEATGSVVFAPGRQGALALLGVLSVLVLTAAVSEEMSRVLLGFWGSR